MKTVPTLLYARFSPRPLTALCRCGNQVRIEATQDATVSAACRTCGETLTIPNCESCESQIAEMRAYIDAHPGQYEIIGEYQDKAVSGGDDWIERPALMDVLTAVRRDYCLMVRSLDRLFRDVTRGLMFRAQLAAKGTKLFSITEPAASMDTPEGKLMSTMFLAFAQYQREISRARTKAKILLHQHNGRRMSRPDRCPFGWMLDPRDQKRLIICRPEQKTIQLIRDMAERGTGLRAIARVLEDLKILRRGKTTWNHLLIRSILRRAGVSRVTADQR